MSVVEPAMFDMAGLLPSTRPTQMVQSGNGASGLVVSLVQIGTRLVFRGLDPLDKGELKALSMVFVVLMGAASASIIAIYFLQVRRARYYMEYVTGPKDGMAPGVEHGAPAHDGKADLDRRPGSFKAAVEAARHVWPSLLAIMLTFTTSLTLWPVIPGRSCATEDGQGTLQSWWFPIVILSYNLSDFLGKSATSSLQWGARALGPMTQLLLAAIRVVVFVPLILTSSAPQLYPTNVARCVVVLSVFALGLSNGWLSTVCFMRAPKALPKGIPNEVAEQASTVLVVGLFFGISLGSVIAERLGSGPLHDSLGVCFDADA